MDEINRRLAPLETGTLKEMAQKLMSDMRDGTDLVLDCVMNVLLDRMTESDYVKFCDSL